VTAGADGMVLVHDLRITKDKEGREEGGVDLAQLLRSSSRAVLAAALHPRGVVGLGGADRAVRLWSAAGGQPPSGLCGHLGPVELLEFSRDGGLLVSFSSAQTHVVKSGGRSASSSPLQRPAPQQLLVRDVRTGAEKLELTWEPAKEGGRPAVALSAD